MEKRLLFIGILMGLNLNGQIQYELISKDDNVSITRDGVKQENQYPQWTNYNLIIGARGDVNMIKTKGAGSNHAYIEQIQSDPQNTFDIEYSDESNGTDNQTALRGTIDFNKPVPWINHGSMKIMVNIPTDHAVPIAADADAVRKALDASQSLYHY